MKPSPVPSILLLVAALALAFSLLGRGWSNHESDNVSVHAGPLWGEVCVDIGEGMSCKTNTIFSDLGKNISPFSILGLVFVLCGIAGMIVSGIAGILLFSKPRTGLTMVGLILIGVAALIVLGLFFYGMSKGGRLDVPGYGFFVFFLGAALAIVGSILGMSSKRGGQPMHPGYGRPPGYPPPGYGHQPPGYPPPGYPPNPPQAPMGAADYAHAPAPQSPMHSCGLPMTWDAQAQRWGCQRCGVYG